MRAYPEVVRELQGEDGDAFVVEGARDGAGDVAGDNGDEAGRQQAGALVPQLPREEKGGDGGQAAEHRGQEHAHVADVHGDVQQVQHVVDEPRRDHQAWIHLDEDEKEPIKLLHHRIDSLYPSSWKRSQTKIPDVLLRWLQA